jgi:pyridoxamine 5'-phosphate oxidase
MPDLHNIRKEYVRDRLAIDQLDTNPFVQFGKWLDASVESGVDYPNAMVLSTVGKNGRPSSRTVLLKNFDPSGYVFFTNYKSRKGNELEENHYASLLFPWLALERQVRIEGIVKQTLADESDAYFNERPVESRIAAIVSEQSSEIPSREYLENLVNKLREGQKGNLMPRPDHWGGYRLVPDRFEFWQGRENRLHDRFEYYLVNDEWKIRRLAP